MLERKGRDEGWGGSIDIESENIMVDGRCNKWMNYFFFFLNV